MLFNMLTNSKQKKHYVFNLCVAHCNILQPVGLVWLSLTPSTKPTVIPTSLSSASVCSVRTPVACVIVFFNGFHQQRRKCQYNVSPAPLSTRPNPP